MNQNFYYTDRFNGAGDCYEDADIVIIGAPMDYTVSGKPGTRQGPAAVRSVSWAMELYSPKLNRELNKIKYYDAGDLILPFGGVERSLDMIERSIAKVLDDGKIPFTFGGEHLITYPAIKAFSKRYEDLVLIHLDAHGDMREEFFGEEASHATVIRHCSNFLKPKHVFQVGIRSGPKSEFDYAKENMRFYPFKLEDAILDINDFCKGKPVYITLDIDVLDPAYAPGTGTPEPQGVTSLELFNFIYSLKDLNVVGIDVVEISPIHDLGNITAVTGCNLFREMCLKFFYKD